MPALIIRVFAALQTLVGAIRVSEIPYPLSGFSTNHNVLDKDVYGTIPPAKVPCRPQSIR